MTANGLAQGRCRGIRVWVFGVVRLVVVGMLWNTIIVLKEYCSRWKCWQWFYDKWQRHCQRKQLSMRIEMSWFFVKFINFINKNNYTKKESYVQSPKLLYAQHKVRYPKSIISSLREDQSSCDQMPYVMLLFIYHALYNKFWKIIPLRDKTV